MYDVSAIILNIHTLKIPDIASYRVTESEMYTQKCCQNYQINAARFRRNQN